MLEYSDFTRAINRPGEINCFMDSIMMGLARVVILGVRLTRVLLCCLRLAVEIGALEGTSPPLMVIFITSTPRSQSLPYLFYAHTGNIEIPTRDYNCKYYGDILN